VFGFTSLLGALSVQPWRCRKLVLSSDINVAYIRLLGFELTLSRYYFSSDLLTVAGSAASIGIDITTLTLRALPRCLLE